MSKLLAFGTGAVVLAALIGAKVLAIDPAKYPNVYASTDSFRQSVTSAVTAPEATIVSVQPTQKLICTIENSTGTSSSPCNLIENRMSDDKVNIIFVAETGVSFTFFTRYADQGGLEVYSTQVGSDAPVPVLGFCDLGDGEAGCQVSDGTNVAKFSAVYQ